MDRNFRATSMQVLVAVRSHPDGSFEMQPGFSTRGRGYRFEDDHGEQGAMCCGMDDG